MKNILICTNNINKIHEYSNILPQNFNLFTLQDLNINSNPIEDGDSFKENAKIKIKDVILNFDLDNIDYVISEDSGLEVDALNGAPGIYSKRYNQDNLSISNNELLLNNLKGEVNRNANFYAFIALFDLNTKSWNYFDGKTDGKIQTWIDSTGEGFAYDFVFVPKNYSLSFAKLGTNVKNSISHRKKAITNLTNFLINLK